jgi:hypothetical protein
MFVFLMFLIFLGTRLLALNSWISDPDSWSQVFNTPVWPLLGVIVLPLTTLSTVNGLEQLCTWVVVAADLAINVVGVVYVARGKDAINPLKLVDKSDVFRVFLRLLMLVIGVLAALWLYIVFALAGLPTRQEYVEAFTILFLIYLSLGFLFCFVDPAMPWLAVLLLSGPPILIALYSNSLVFFAGFIASSAGAATLGAFLGGYLRNRRKDKRSLEVKQQSEL